MTADHRLTQTERSDAVIGVLSKPAHQIGGSDIESLIASNVPEGEQIEFKESLSTEKDTVDPWVDGKDKIGNQAKEALLTEAVGFCQTAYGGAVLLGIRESEAKPPVAAKIVPIQRCADLAERLKLVFRDRVEPQLPRIDIFAVPTDDESGVVIIRVGRSRMARIELRRYASARSGRADRCEEMSMREIQDMTLNVSRGLERLGRQLSERSDRFRQEFECLKPPENAGGIRLTAAPVGDEIRIDRVFRNTASPRSSKSPGIRSYISRATRTPAHLRGWNAITPYCPIPGNPGCALHERTPLTATFLRTSIRRSIATG